MIGAIQSITEQAGMPPLAIIESPEKPDREEANSSYRLMEYARESCRSFVDSFDAQSESRGPGAPSITQQDLLRATLVFAGAGLDAAAKQLVKDCLQTLAVQDPAVMKEAEKTCSRLIAMQRADAGIRGVADSGVLARILLGGYPQAVLLDMLVEDLIRGSLQSWDALCNIGKHLGVSHNEFGPRKTEVHEAFGVRNIVIHELDADMEQEYRNRISRRRTLMVRLSNILLRVGDGLVHGVDSRLKL
jgi:hypothetical protein